MGQEQRTFSDTGAAPEIEALLSLSRSASIVDGLLAMPRVAGEEPNEWDRAVSNRLAMRLASQMKSMLAEGARRNAA